MIKEFSAGGIVYKINDDKVVWLVCQHSQHKGWVFPKGFIGDHPSAHSTSSGQASSGQAESKKEAALREVEEETGVKGKIITKLPKPAGYFYVWKGEKRFKTVYYFLMEYAGGDIKNHDFEMMKVEWWPKEKVEKSLTYKSDKTAFKEALKLFKNAGRASRFAPIA